MNQDLRARTAAVAPACLTGTMSAVSIDINPHDEVPEQSPRRQLANWRYVAMRRPNRLVGDAAGDALNRSFWYDGKTFAALDREQRR